MFGRFDAPAVIVVLFFFVFAALFALDILIGLTVKLMRAWKFRNALRYGRVRRAVIDKTRAERVGMVSAIVERDRVELAEKWVSTDSVQVLYHRDSGVVIPVSELEETRVEQGK